MAVGAVLQGLSLFPRGGSAHVVRYLTAALLQYGWQIGALAGRPFELEVNEAVEGNRGRDLALHEHIHVADVAGHDRSESKGPARVAPRAAGLRRERWR